MKEKLKVYQVLLNYLLAKRTRNGDQPAPATDSELCEEYKRVAKIIPAGGYSKLSWKREAELDYKVKSIISFLRRKAAQEHGVVIVTIPANMSGRVRTLLGISHWPEDDTIRVVVDESKTILDKRLARYEDRKRTGLIEAYAESEDEFNEVASKKGLIVRKGRQVIARQIEKGTKPKELEEMFGKDQR